MKGTTPAQTVGPILRTKSIGNKKVFSSVGRGKSGKYDLSDQETAAKLPDVVAAMAILPPEWRDLFRWKYSVPTKNTEEHKESDLHLKALTDKISTLEADNTRLRAKIDEILRICNGTPPISNLSGGLI